MSASTSNFLRTRKDSLIYTVAPQLSPIKYGFMFLLQKSAVRQSCGEWQSRHHGLKMEIAYAGSQSSDRCDRWTRSGDAAAAAEEGGSRVMFIGLRTSPSTKPPFPKGQPFMLVRLWSVNYWSPESCCRRRRGDDLTQETGKPSIVFLYILLHTSSLSSHHSTSFYLNLFVQVHSSPRRQINSCTHYSQNSIPPSRGPPSA